MLSLSFLTLYLAALGAYAKPMVRSATGLEISLSTPADKVKVSELRVVATVKNVRDEDLKVLKLGTVLDNEHPTRSFFVTKDGKQVPFTGVEVPVVTERVSERYWMIIPAGKDVTTEHDVSALYDFFATGPGTFTFDPVSSFQVSGLNDTDETILDPVVIDAEKAGPISITVTDHVSKRELGLEKRVAVDCTDMRKEWSIFLSFLDAKQLASGAASYLREHGSKSVDYKNHFGSSTMQQVIDNFDAAANQDWATRTTSCSTTSEKCRYLGPAYTLDSSIHYCNDFYDVPSLGSYCKDSTHLPTGAITLREFAVVLWKATRTPFICGSGMNSPGASVSESYPCFATWVYKNTKCKR